MSAARQVVFSPCPRCIRAAKGAVGDGACGVSSCTCLHTMWLLVLRCLGARAKFCSMKLAIQYSTERRTTPKQHDDAVDEQLGTEGDVVTDKKDNKLSCINSMN